MENSILFINLAGNSGVQLLQEITGNYSELDTSEQNGKIKVHQSLVGTKNAKIFYLSDTLAEQCSYRFFLSERTIAIIVADLVSQEKQLCLVNYWKQELRKCINGHVVIVFWDKESGKSETESIINIEDDDFIFLHKISELRPGDFVNFKSFLLELLKHKENPINIPPKWTNVRTKLNHYTSDLIAYDEVISLFIKEGVEKKEEQKSLAKWLHETGTALIFCDDLRLQKFAILHLSWVTSAIFSLHNSNAVFTNRGILELRMLEKNQVLQDYTNEEKVFLLDIMSKHGLCIDIDVPNQLTVGYLIPTLERGEKFVGEWNNKDVELVFRYTNYPIHIVPHLVARLYPYILKHTHWQEGCLFTYGENEQATTALVAFLPSENSIKISIKGANKNSCSELAALIREEIQKVNEKLEFGTPVLEVIDVKPTQKAKTPVVIKNSVFVTVPKTIGRFFLDIFGRDKATDTSAVILGYVLIIIALAIALGLVNLDTVVNWFKYNWRFFFPEPK